MARPENPVVVVAENLSAKVQDLVDDIMRGEPTAVLLKAAHRIHGSADDIVALVEPAERRRPRKAS